MSIWDSMERDFGENVENRIKILEGVLWRVLYAY